MSQIQQGRAVSRRVFKKPKDYLKAEKMYNEAFPEKSGTAADTAKWKPQYSRVTNKIITKTKTA